jgi:ubiquinone/menaquinone biosynthesis C-methylase UbiE
MKSERMWDDLAKFYDLEYEWKDYKKESAQVHKLIFKNKKSKGKELLDVACGTGNHIPYLKKHYNVTGTDLNFAMLKEARKKFLKIKFFQGDMVNFYINKEFDVVVCLFASIGYVRTYANLEKTIKTFSRHLKEGGVAIIEPFVHPNFYKTGNIHTLVSRKKEVHIVRMNVSEKKKDRAILDFHFLVGTKKGVKYIKDRHELGLFDPKKFIKIMKENGFEKVRFVKNGLMKNRGVMIGVKK